ncbi:MAG: adenylyl-sulfate kinase [Chloroflexota bacterium]|nr:MAG: adenylyl-sulfate kinase [Chloroflexota bacterium]
MKKGFALWFTGLSGAGKSTIANLLVERLHTMDRPVELLDGDEIRKNLSQGLGFSKADRDANIQRIAFVAKLLSRYGVIAITAAISPYRETRDRAREEIGTEHFVEVFIDCPLQVCEERDVKGLYARARTGEIAHFTGISDPYEAPTHAEITLHTNRETPEESVESIVAYLAETGKLTRDEMLSSNHSYTPQEEALVEERLRNLGYL